MADLGHETRRKMNKRKQRTSKEEGEEKQRGPSKACRIEDSVCENKELKGMAEESETRSKLDDGHPWRNLQLILSLQNIDIDLQEKVELAFEYVKSRGSENADGSSQALEIVSMSRVIPFLNNWVQSILISSEKKATGSCLDFRCWMILKFCLEESLKQQVPLSFSRDFLRVIHFTVRDVFHRLNAVSSHSKDTGLTSEELELCNIFLDCISLLFSSHGGVSNENLDLWILTVDAVVELVHKIFSDKLDCGRTGIFVFQLSCFVLDPFVKFLRVHPARKKGFQDFVDKLLEPLLHLMDVLHLHICGDNSRWTRNVLKLVEEVLSQGLFHPVHIDGFLCLQSTGKYKTSDDERPKGLRTIIKSYHRHLFDKLEKIISGKNALALGGLGELFCLFAHCVKRQKGVLVSGGDSGLMGDNFTGKLKNSSHNKVTCVMNVETRKSLFNFFVQIMEPLLLEINTYVQAELEVGPVLLDVHCLLKSTNRILVNIIHENVYMQMEDNSEGAFVNFLKVIYDLIISFSAKISQLWQSIFVSNQETHAEVLNLIAKELVVSVQYLLEIEHEVVGDDLESLWLMMFSYAALHLSLVDLANQSLLTSEILHLGCQLLKLYSELRQVNNSIFALCKAVRCLVLPARDGERNSSKFKLLPSLYSESYTKLLRMVLCSVELRFSICNAIKSIPEGQASGCIQQLSADISESLEWIKINGLETLDISTDGMLSFNLQVEILGRGLSEVYSLILDALPLTISNSNLVGVAVKDLMVVIYPCMSSLVGLQPDAFNNFLFLVTGRTCNKGGEYENDLLSAHWIFLFFFRLYMFCRSLYHQAMSLVPPNTSRKMSEAMGDPFTAYSGKDWLERTGWTDEGYFSWIVQPSASLFTIIQAVSDIYLHDSVADCPPLVYVMNAMAVQRLVDLNRMIRSYEYLIQRNDRLRDDAGLSLYCKRSRKWKSGVSDLRQEAANLTNFMMKYLSLVMGGQLFITSSSDATHKDMSIQAPYQNDTWDFGVGALTKKSLPSAIWSIICQSIDIWCKHASRRNLKVFLSLLIRNSLLHVPFSLDDSEKYSISKLYVKEVTVCQMSLELLSSTVLYEQKFVCRHMAMMFCRILQKLVCPLFYNFSEVDLKSPLDWTVALHAVENLLACSDDKYVIKNGSSEVPMFLCSSNSPHVESCEERELISSIKVEFAACQSLLKFLCWMPKGFLKYRSLSNYAICILNLERLVVGRLLDCHCDPYLQNHNELFRLFVSCRRALNNIVMEFFNEKRDLSCRSSLAYMLCETSFPVLWLLKSLSAVIRLQHAVSKGTTKVKDMTLLMDHTSYVFLTLSKDQSINAIQSLIAAGKPGEERSYSVITYEQIDFDPCFDSFKVIDAWKSVVLVAETLREQVQNKLTSLKEAIGNEKVGVFKGIQEVKNLSSIISCFQGFLWGLSSALDHIDPGRCNPLKKLLRYNFEPIYKVNLCIDTFADFINCFLRLLFLEDDQVPQCLSDVQTLPTSQHNEVLVGVGDYLCEGSACVDDEILYDEEQRNYGTERNCSVSLVTNDDLGKSAQKKRSRLEKEDLNNILNKIDLSGPYCLKKSLLRGFLRGENLEVAIFLRQLFIASSAILRLNLQISCTSLTPSLVPIFISISRVLLLDFANKIQVLEPFLFVWLDGVVKFLEQLGSHFPLSNPSLSRNIYIKLMDLHFRAIGKCISLQGKGAILASHETESSTKTLNGQMGSSGYALSQGPYCLDEFKARLRISFKVFVQKSSELHLLSMIQAIERALVGVKEGCMINYEICTGSANGGKVSSIVAAGIDCLDLVLEFVTGRKHLNVVKRRIQSLVACLFNIILHLQGPRIFFGNGFSNGGDANADPDPGSVILMCVEVLTRVAAKHSLFQLDTCHVGQSLRVPAALFQNFLQLKITAMPADFNPPSFSETKNLDSMGSNPCVVDRQFSVGLYAACCRLLCTILKHHKSESQRCIALLEDSVSVLLSCLEMVAGSLVVRRGFFVLEEHEGVKCASFLRRVYEEIRQQKDFFGRHSFLLLSNYIWIYCGYGPLKSGIRREIDEALRPGVYALIDVCSADDLQHLHTVFGEGPCRSTLATLQHGYKQNFKYEGKV